MPLATLAKRCDSSPTWMAGEQSSPAWMAEEQSSVPLAPLAKHSRSFSWNGGLLGAPEAHGSSAPAASDHSAGGEEEAEFTLAATFPPMYGAGQPRQFFSTPAPHRHQPPPQNTPHSLPRQQSQPPHQLSHQPPQQQQQRPHKPQHQQNHLQQTQEGAAQAKTGQSNKPPPVHPQLSTHPPMDATPGCEPLAAATCALSSPKLPVSAAGAVTVPLFMPTPPKMPPPPHIKPVAIPSPNGNGAGTPVALVGHPSPPRGLPRLVLLLLCILRACES